MSEKWRYSKLRTMDISNGPNIRVSLFTQGCKHGCKGCFNPETWCLSSGKEWTDDVDNKIIDTLKKDYIKGLSILGGDPFLYYEDEIYTKLDKTNENRLLSLVKRVKTIQPNKSIWLWTGYVWEDFFNESNFSSRVQEILPYIDVIVDGEFVEKLYSSELLYSGSTNQRIIDVQKSLLKKEIIEIF